MRWDGVTLLISTNCLGSHRAKQTIRAVYLVPVAETTQPREHRRRSRATDTAELDAAGYHALAQQAQVAFSIWTRRCSSSFG